MDGGNWSQWWCVAETISVTCGTIDSSYRELGKDLSLHWTDTHKEETAAKERGKKCCHS